MASLAARTKIALWL